MSKTIEIARHILSNPVVKRRTPLWFFTEECRKQWEKNDEEQKSGCSLKRNKIWECWRNMSPESKRQYFNMAELDRVRFREEQTAQIAKVGSLLANQCNELTDQEDQKNLDDSSRDLKYERLVQTKTTRTLYRDVIRKMKGLETGLETNSELITAIPETYRSVLTRPRRPPTPFILFALNEKERILAARKENKATTSFFKSASEEWTYLQPEGRAKYEKKYNSLIIEYNKAMEKFKEKNMSDTYLELASKEKKALQKSLRKKLRDSNVLPLNVRNAFNFFLMDNKDVPLTELTKIWRQLPEEQKLKYKLLTKEDLNRYLKEKQLLLLLLREANISRSL